MSDWKESVYQSYVSVYRSHVAGNRAADFGKSQLKSRRPYFESIIHKHFPTDPATRILDIGCGYGALLYFLGKLGYRNAVGVDVSQEQVDLSRQLGVVGVTLGEAQSFLCGCEAASKDVVCLLDVIEHLSIGECFDLLSEVRRVLAQVVYALVTFPMRKGYSVCESDMTT